MICSSSCVLPGELSSISYLLCPTDEVCCRTLSGRTLRQRPLRPGTCRFGK